VKEFWIYTGLRVLLSLGALAIVAGIWAATAGEVPILWAVVIAFLVSGVGSYFLLARQREAFARRVESRAQKATAKIEEMRSKEDAD
jgi:mannitol-specific phosphotransferase system IIBC component